MTPTFVYGNPNYRFGDHAQFAKLWVLKASLLARERADYSGLLRPDRRVIAVELGPGLDRDIPSHFGRRLGERGASR